MSFEENPLVAAPRATPVVSIPWSIILGAMLFVGIGAAVVFLLVVAPVVGEEKVETVFGENNLNPIFDDTPAPPAQPVLEPVCGNQVCEPEETTGNCFQDCFECNANGTCDSSIGENQNSCPTDCPLICNADGICQSSNGENTTNCASDCVIASGSGSGSGSGGGSGGGASSPAGTSPSPPPAPPAPPASTCGNSLLESGETCDDGDASNSDGCSASCQSETGWNCSGQPSTCTAICGDGLVLGTEFCDGANLNNQTCSSVGYQSGNLSCNSNCTFNTSACLSAIPNLGGTPTITQSLLLSGTNFTAQVYAYVYGSGTQAPSGSNYTVIPSNTTFFVYLIQNTGTNSIIGFAVDNDVSAVINSIGSLNTVPSGLSAQNQQQPAVTQLVQPGPHIEGIWSNDPGQNLSVFASGHWAILTNTVLNGSWKNQYIQITDETENSAFDTGLGPGFASCTDLTQNQNETCVDVGAVCGNNQNAENTPVNYCSDGHDNDCDGTIDAEDSDCLEISTPPPTGSA